MGAPCPLYYYEDITMEKQKGASNPTPSTNSIPDTTPKTLDAANAIDNLEITRGKGK